MHFLLVFLHSICAYKILLFTTTTPLIEAQRSITSHFSTIRYVLSKMIVTSARIFGPIFYFKKADLNQDIKEALHLANTLMEYFFEESTLTNLAKIMYKFLQGNLTLRHLLNEKSIIIMLTEICYKKSK